jgi:hypothetical protein
MKTEIKKSDILLGQTVLAKIDNGKECQYIITKMKRNNEFECDIIELITTEEHGHPKKIELVLI